SAEGIIIRIPAKDISIQGRNTQGVRIINLKPGDKVAGIARIEKVKPEKDMKLTAFNGKEAAEVTGAGEEAELPEDEAEDFEEPDEFEDLEAADEEQIEEDKAEEENEE
ncbi:MAG: DNA gyrase C-terminal beta-propeller domain-containing protein, partial [Bacteroidota bacterium]|nr:DNA gyrase C-terminal beta-propeller domain-containing protein [Bacteroidota bacterium]